MPVNDYINEFRAAKNDDSRESVIASSLVVNNIAECNNEQAQAAVEGTRYIDVAEQTGGLVSNIETKSIAIRPTSKAIEARRQLIRLTTKRQDFFPLKSLKPWWMKSGKGSMATSWMLKLH